MKGFVMITGVLVAALLGGCGDGGAMRNAAADDVAAPSGTNAAVPASATVAPVATPVAATPPQPAETLDAFWTKFRKAALENDTAGIAALSAPVVMQHGLLDDSPKHRLSPAEAAPLLLKLLDDPNNTDDEGRTNRQLLAATRKPELDTGWSTERLRLGDLEFAHGAKGWRFVQFYYEP